MIIRIIGGLIFVVVVYNVMVEWIFTPATPDLPSFQQVEMRLQDMVKVRQAESEGRVIEDPVRGELRQNVVTTFERLDQAPCDEGLREDFVAAVIPFLEAVYETRNRAPIETVEVEGKVLNATAYLDKEALDKISMAGMFGLLSHRELPRHLISLAGAMTSQFEEAAARVGQKLSFPGHNCG